jgi:pre-mRNA-splicing factor 38A
MSAYTTDPFAKTIHGKDPQLLIEKIARDRIRECRYWSEKCFGLDAATLVECASKLDCIGGMYSEMNKPTDFICLVLKMLQIQPSKEVVLTYIRNEQYKYLRALGAFYLRVIGNAKDIYGYLEPLQNDYRKLRHRGISAHSSGILNIYIYIYFNIDYCMHLCSKLLF